MFVVARNAPRLYQGQAISPQQVRRELGVQYVLEGSVRRADEQVRVTVQLVNAATGYHVWAYRYDRAWQDIFALQDDITQKIVAALAVQLKAEERAQLALRCTQDVEAYDSEEAIAAFKRTLTRNPDYLLARLRLAALYNEAGQTGHARTQRMQRQELSRDGSLAGARQTLPYTEAQDLERMLAALRGAGLR